MSTKFVITISVVMLLAVSGCWAAARATHVKWERIELSLQGPASKGLGHPNPFEVVLDVIFTHSDGASYRVPAFYDGDGRGGMDGNVWKVRFAADRTGLWSWRTESAVAALANRSGSFTVRDAPADAPELFRKGRLEYAGKRYLKFRDGGYWVKAGADEPENILGGGFGADWDAKKRQIDYLASAGINALYVMTHNLDGDGNDVWPWYGNNGLDVRLNKDRYDVARLGQWADFLDYVQRKGLVIQLVLEDDSAWSGYDHARYYREMVARFGYLPALHFNFCEEYNERYSLAEALAHMKTLSGIDPYDHPRAIHNVREPDPLYLDSSYVNVTSIQTQPETPARLNALSASWIQAAALRGARPPVVSFDEARPATDRRSWWAVYLGGGMWETYEPVPKGYASMEPLWRELARAHRFIAGLPFAGMVPANSIVNGGEAFCLAKAGEAYGCYLPAGGEVRLALPRGALYKAEWFDPASDATADWRGAGSHDGGLVTLAAPSARDWALRLTCVDGKARVLPTPAGGELQILSGRNIDVHLRPMDGSVPSHSIEIVEQPRYGSLSVKRNRAVYSPRKGFTGVDQFAWRFRSRDETSDTAAVRLRVIESAGNQRPLAKSLTVETQAGQPVSIILPYEDADGPGPHRIEVRREPAHGRLTGKENDVVYTPNSGFKGLDYFEWTVADSAGLRSRPVRLEIIVK
jgi:hypothetical protein